MKELEKYYENIAPECTAEELTEKVISKAETDRPIEPSVAPNAEKAAEDGRPRAAGSVFAAPSGPSEPRPSAEADA